MFQGEEKISVTVTFIENQSNKGYVNRKLSGKKVRSWVLFVRLCSIYSVRAECTSVYECVRGWTS